MNTGGNGGGGNGVNRYPAQLDSALSPPPGALFPSRLYQLLEDSETEGNTDIISWMPDGRSFKVHNKERFESELMPRYFGSSKYRSFQKVCVYVSLSLSLCVCVCQCLQTIPTL